MILPFTVQPSRKTAYTHKKPNPFALFKNFDMPDNKTSKNASTSGTASSTGGTAAAAAAAANTTSSAGAASSTATASPTGATTTAATSSSSTAALEKMVLERDQDLIDCLIKGEQSRVDRRRG